VPVAVLRLVLRTLTRPDAELRVAEPVRAMILPERIPRWPEFSRRHRFVLRVDNDRGRLGFGKRISENLRTPAIRNGSRTQNKDYWQDLFQVEQ